MFRVASFFNFLIGYRGVSSISSEPDSSKPTVGKYLWYSYEQVERTAQHIGSGLVARNLVAPNDTGLQCVGIYAKTRIEMFLAEAAIMRQGFVDVALYDTMGAEAGAFIVSQVCTR